MSTYDLKMNRKIPYPSFFFIFYQYHFKLKLYGIFDTRPEIEDIPSGIGDDFFNHDFYLFFTYSCSKISVKKCVHFSSKSSFWLSSLNIKTIPCHECYVKFKILENK